MSYHVYNSTAAAKDLTSKNGLFVALALLGAYHTEEVQACPTEIECIKKAVACYSNANEKEQSRLAKYMVNHIYTIMSTKGISISRRKCMKCVATTNGERIYTDTDITIFAEILLSMIKDNRMLLMELNKILQHECYRINATSELGDCVHHLFGFQYENLKRIIPRRIFQNSRKTRALRKCLDDMSVILNSASYPNTCERH